MNYVLALSICLVAVTAGAATPQVEPALFKYYQTANNTETRLAEFKDSDEVLRMKLIQLAEINKSRKRHRVEPVQLDILASRVANKMSKEAAENRYCGHWNMAGETPYQRYAFAGGHDHVSENAYAQWTSGRYRQSNENSQKLMREGHRAFMAERAPNNGHKKTVIDKDHNFVGIGFHLTESYFTYYEEFLDRYFTFSDVPQTVKSGERFEIGIAPQTDQFPYFLLAYYEKEPKPMKPAKIQRRSSYQDYTNKEAMELHPYEMTALRTDNGEYRVPMQFKKPGLYYIKIYQHKKAISKPSGYTTRKKTQGSGIVIRVVE